MIVNPIVVDMDVGTPTKVPMSVETPTTVGMGFNETINVIIRPITLEDKSITPSDNAQIVTFDEGYQGLRQVTVDPIPSNYGKIEWNGSVLSVT